MRLPVTHSQHEIASTGECANQQHAALRLDAAAHCDHRAHQLANQHGTHDAHEVEAQISFQ